MNWIEEFEENTQRVGVSFFNTWRMFGKVCHLLLEKKKKRICKAVKLSGFIDEKKMWCFWMIIFIIKWLFLSKKTKYNFYLYFKNYKNTSNHIVFFKEIQGDH